MYLRESLVSTDTFRLIFSVWVTSEIASVLLTNTKYPSVIVTKTIENVNQVLFTYNTTLYPT